MHTSIHTSVCCVCGHKDTNVGKSSPHKCDICTYSTFIVDDSHDNQCSICLSDINKNDCAYNAKFIEDDEIKCVCNHVFHLECIKRWFGTKNYTCPCCRKNMVKRESNDGMFSLGFDISEENRTQLNILANDISNLLTLISNQRQNIIDMNESYTEREPETEFPAQLFD